MGYDKAIEAAADFGKGITSVVSEFVEDKDLSKKLTSEIEKKRLEFANTIVMTSTIPWVDALVKIMYASRDCLIPLFRPIGTALLTAWGCYLSYKGVEGGTEIKEALLPLVASVPQMQWIHARSQEKKLDKKTELRKEFLKAKDKPGYWDSEDYN